METKLGYQARLAETRRQEASTTIEAINVSITLLQERQRDEALAYARACAKTAVTFDHDRGVVVKVCDGDTAASAYRAFVAAAKAGGATTPAKLPKELPELPDMEELATAANNAADEENGDDFAIPLLGKNVSHTCGVITFESCSGAVVELTLSGINTEIGQVGTLTVSAPTTRLVPAYRISAAIAALVPF